MGTGYGWFSYIAVNSYVVVDYSYSCFTHHQVACQTSTPRYGFGVALSHGKADVRLCQSAHIFDIYSRRGGGGRLEGFRTCNLFRSCAFARSTGKLVRMICVNCQTKIA